MAITIATMGRLMKKLDMNLGSFQELWLASSWTMAQGRRSGYAALASYTLVFSVPPAR
jgi:hypothetical protein